jgi:hypothetical protein
MGVVIFEIGSRLLLPQFVKSICSDVMDIDELASRFTGDGTTPRTVGLVATLNVEFALLLVDRIDEAT